VESGRDLLMHNATVLIMIKIMIPEIRLWLHVLVDAVESAIAGDQADRVWIFISTDTDERYSFEWVCHVLGSDPQCVREFLRKNWSTIDFHGVSVAKRLRRLMGD
jgi:hypothetical protein